MSGSSQRRRTAGRGLLLAFIVVAALTVKLSSGAATLTDPCSSPGWNVITCENSKPGTPSTTWGAGGAGDTTLQGFPTDISVDHGQTVSFKITDTNGGSGVGSTYHIDIYRVGYYQGNGARLQATIPSTSVTAKNQGSCLTEASTGLTDCGNWTVSATWAVPAAAVSGLYFANLVRDGSGTNSHIYFIVRDDERHAPLLFQTSDETWEAYNAYGGNSLYVGTAPTSNGRAWKVSYNRPLTTGNNSPRNEPLYAEYPMIRFLEKNGYDLSYFTDVDSARSPSELLNHKTFMSVGHDEYWSAEQRNNVVAARNAGVNLAFFSGNEIFWKTRFAASIATGAQSWRTVVCYKESKEPTAIDPADPPTSTGAWRDPRFGAPADGAKPENAVSGQIYMVDAIRDDAIAVPYAYSKLRFWNNTSVAGLTAGQTATMPTGTLGYEWDEDLDNGSRPAGLIDMSSTTVPVTTLVTDSTGQAEGSGTATHHLTLYRASSGALVFGSGTVQWSFGLDNQHTTVQDTTTSTPSADMQQATVNLLADMGAQPATIQSGLVTATKSTDTTPPTTTITYPTPSTLLDPTQSVTVTGTASDTGGVVAGVEVSTDGGATWHPATGTTSWSYTFTPGAFGQITIESRATDDSANIQSPPTSVTVSVGACPCNIFGQTTPANPSVADPNPYELGVKFRSDVAGYVTGIRFYKGTGNTGTHVGHLWAGTGGQALAAATFTNETTTGWQQVNFASPIAIAANTTYVASYFTNSGTYAADRSYFSTRGVDTPPLHALADGVDGSNGVFASGGGFPTASFQSSNYYVDVVFNTSNPPAVSAVTPTVGKTDVASSTAVTATFSQPMNAGTIGSTTMTLRDSGGTLVPATVSYDSASLTATLTPNQPIALSTTYTATIKGGASGVKNASGTAMTADYTWSFTTATPAACPCTIFPASATPTTASSFDTTANELGVKFRSDQSGYIRGLRFYKGPGNTGTHVGHLWSSTGTMLAEITFTNESAGGWQQVDFPRPVAVAANTTYIASYYAPNGGYALDRPYFGTGVDRSPLHALADGAAGPNGVFAAGGGFPTQGSSASNYWVDAVFDTNGNDTTPPLVSSVSPTAGATGIATSRTASVSFNEPMDPLSITTTNIQLRDPSNAVVPASVSYDTGKQSAIVTPSSPLALSTTYTLVAKGGTGGATDASGNPLASDFTSTFTTGTPAACPCNLLDSSTPTVASSTDTAPTEVGVKFRSDIDGYITGIRFYKGLQNTGTHVGHLWSSTGTMMGTATFTNETSTGWQQVSFASPVAIRANTTYIASYFAPNGGYALDRPYYTSWLDRPPLHALADGVEGSNGVYAAGQGFPTQAFDTSASNYWVDPVFDTSGDRIPPTVTSTSPAANATGIFRNTTVSAVFSEALDPSSIGSSTFVLRDATNTVVPATVTYNPATTTATLSPGALLTAGATYSATISGGASGVKDANGNALASDFTWSFTISSDTTAPTTTISCSGGGCVNWFSTSPVTVTLSAADNGAGSGVNATKYTIDGSDPTTSSSAALYTAPFTVTTTTTIRYSSTDKAGNVETPGSAQIRIDTTPPSAPSLSFGGFSNASAAGSTVYFNPGAAGGFTVTANSTDGESGIATVNYPSFGTGWSRSGGAYAFTAGATDPVEPNNITATNNAGLTSSATGFTVTADGTAPATTLTCNGAACPSWSTSSPVTVALNASDGGSGVASTYYTTDGSDPSVVHGTLYLGAFTVAATATVKFRSYDNVGNAETIHSQPIRIDTTPPPAPSLAFSGLSGAAVVGGVVYFNPGAGGGFTLTAASTDPESGIASYGYPSLAAGWTRSAGVYTFVAGATDPTEPNNVTATNSAGLTSSPTSFTVTADSAAPATTATCNGGGCGGWLTTTPVSLALTASDGGSGVAQILYSTDGSAPSLVYSSPLSLSSTTTVKFQAVDKVGNTEPLQTQTVQIDATAPAAPTLTISPAAGTAVTASTVFYNPAAAGGFNVVASSADPESGIASYGYPSLGLGWSNTNGSYSYGAGALQPSPASVTATNNAGLTSAGTTFSAVSDSAAPTTTINCSGGCGAWHTTSPVTVTLSSDDGSGSGLDRILYSTDGSTPSLLYTAPCTVASTATVKFAAYDRVGNLETAKSQLVQVDTTPPSAPTLSLGGASGGAALSDGVVYFNPASSGGFTVGASSADAESGVATYAYPALGSGWTIGTGGAYSFATGATDPAEPNNVTATNNAGLTSAPTSFTVTADTSAPATTSTCNGAACAGGWYTTSPVTVALAASDSGSGVAKILYSTDGTAPSLTYSAPFVISSTSTVKYAAVDKVGNTEAVNSRLVQIDTTPPSAPSLTLGGLTGGAALTGGVLYFNPDTAGGFTVTGASTDGESGVDHLMYPSLGTGWSNAGGSYTYASGATDPAEPNNVTATNGAGLTSAPTSFTVTADTSAPATTISCNSGACGNWFTASPVTVALNATDTGSGVATTYYTTDGTDPSSTHGQLYAGAFTVSSTTPIRFRSYDKVGNAEAIGSQTVQIDTSAPTTPTLALSAPSPFQTVAGSTVFYNPSGTNTGTFTVAATTGDPESGIAKVTFPSPAGMTGGGDVTSLPYQTSYNWTATSAGSGTQTVTARNNAGLSSSATFTLTPDTSVPTGGSITYTDGFTATGSITITTANGSDGGAGLDPTSAVLQRDAVALTNGACGTFTGTWTAAASPDTTLVSGTCYRYRYLISDKVGNTATYTSASVVKFDSSAPSTPALTLSSASATQFITGTTIYYGNSSAGSFTVTGTSADAESGIKQLTFPAITGMGSGGADTSSPYQGTYTWSTSTTTSGQQNVTATNNANLTSANAPFTVTADNTAPTLAITSPLSGARIRTGALLTPSVSDTGAGIKQVEFRYCAGSGNCNFTQATSFTGNIATSAPYTVGWPSGPADGAYVIVARVTDNVGNSATTSSSGGTAVTVDNTPPFTALSLVNAIGAYITSAGTIYMANTAGSFSLHVDVLDPQPASGVKNVVFPAITSSGWTGPTVTDTTAPYEAPYSFGAAAALPPAKSIVTSDNAGNTQTDTVTFVRDQTIPTVTLTAPAGGAKLRNGSTVSATASDSGSGIKQVEFRYCPGNTCTFASGTTIGTATTSPYTVSWTGQPADGTYTIAVQATDNVGNTATDGTSTITLDNTAPATTLGVVSGTRADLQYFSAGTLYYNPAATGTFTITESATDPNGVASVAFPAIAQTGFNGTAKSATTTPYVSNTYTFDSTDTAAPAPAAVVATDGLGNSRSDSLLLVLDQTGPTGGSITYPNGYAAGGSVSITTNAGIDAGAGVAAATGVIERQVAPLAGDTCGTFGPWAPVTSPDTLASGTCAQYRYRVSDRIGNETVYTSTNVVKSDSTAASAPTLSFSSFTSASATSSTIYFNPAASGGFTVGATSTDPESGVASYVFPSLGNGWTRAGGAYTFAPGASDPIEPNNVTATNGAGLASAPTSFTVTADATAPATSAACNGGSCAGWFTSTPVSVALSATDGGAGVDKILYSTDGGAPSQVYNGSIAVSTTTTIKFAAVDKVGNVESTSSQLVQIDTTAPSAPALSLGGTTGGSAFTGGVLYFNPASSGGFTVTPSSTDGESGVATYSYASLGSGWTNTNGAYSFIAGAADPVEPSNVAATNNAGLTSAPTSFTVTADTTAPTSSVACSGGCAGWHNVTTTVTLDATDGESGLAKILYSTDGTAPSLVYSGPISIGTTTSVRFAAVDNVGNTEATRSQLVQVDTSAPGAPALTLSAGGGSAVTGSTVFYNPAATGGFSVGASSTDPESGVATYTYPALGIGWGSSNGTYTFAAGAPDPVEPNNVTATNNAGLTSAPTSFTVTADTTAPTTAIACSGGCAAWHTASPVTITLTADDGSGSGLDRILYSTSGGTPSVLYTAPFTVTSTATVTFAAYDRVGNVESAKSQLVQVDTTAPSAPSLTLGGATGSAAVSGGVLYFNPASTGAFTVAASSTDAESGVASYHYPSLGSGWTSGTNGAYSFTSGAADPTEPNNVTATNNAGLTSTPTSFTVTADTTAPTTSASCNASACSSSWYTTTPVSVTLNATDGGAGVAKILYSTDGGAPTLTYSGPINLSSTTTVKFAAVDKVGNTEATKSQLVQIDTNAPTAPTLTLGGVSGNAAIAGGVVYFNPAGAGGFTVTAAATDGSSGIDHYTYPALGTGWTNTLNGTYSFVSGASDPAEPNNVTATNGAGTTGAPTSFTVNADSTAPVTTATCNGAACAGWFTSSPVTVTLTATDGGSGVDRILYSTDGTTPTQLYTAPLTIAASANLKFAAYDRVGNLEATNSQPIQIDTTPPSAPSLAFSSLNGAAVTGGALYYNPASSGGFTITPSSTDGESGIAGYDYPALGTGWTNTNGSYSFAAAAADPAEPNNVTARNNAGLTSAPTSVTVTPDSSAPTTTATCNGSACGNGWYTTSPVTLALNAVDGGSGVAKILYSLDGSTPSLVYSGAIGITATTTVTYTATDKVGNSSTGSTTIHVDATAPSTPTLSFSGLTNASVAGSTVYYRSAAGGGFTVTPSSADPESGVASYGYPSLGTGWNATGGAYTFAAGAQQPLGASNLTATNNAGLTSAPAQFTVLRDDTAPTTSIHCNGNACGTGFASASVLVTLTADDGSGSGAVKTMYTLDGTDPSPIHGAVYLGGFSLTSSTTVKFRSYDAVGNEELVGSQLVNVDTTPPAVPLLSLTAPSASEYANGTTLFYNPSGTNTGTFTVAATTSDPDSGIAKLHFPTLAGATGGGDTTTSSSTYTWNATTSASGPQSVTAYNGSGLTSSASFNVSPDTTAPSGGSVSYPDGYQPGGAVTITTSDGSDGGAGIDPAARTLERQTAPLAAGSCGTWSSWSAATSPDTVPDATCARYRYRVSDRVGNQQIYTSANVVKVDGGTPSTPLLTLAGASAGEYVSGTTLYYNPSGSNTGSFTVNASTSAASGIARVTFPSPSGMTGGGDVTASPYTATYGWTQATTASGAQTVTAKSNAGGSSTSTFNVTPDSAAPTGQTAALVGGPWFTSTSISIVTANGSDALSGIAPSTGLIERAAATLTNGTCGTFGPYSGSYSTPDTSVSSGFCYRYRYSIADKVGNRSTPVETGVAMVDTSAPTTPSLAFGGLSHASVNGSTAYYNSNTSGGFTVTSTASDPQSGVAATSFPTFGTGWSGTGGVYTFAAGAADPTEPNNVVATNGAGLASAPAPFTVTADGDAPTGGSIAYTDGYRTSASVSITLANGSDALSGIDAASAILQRTTAPMSDGTCGTYDSWTTIATAPTLAYVDTSVASGNCYVYRYVVSDKVGNTATSTTSSVAKIDTDAPSATLADPGANLRQTVNLSSTTGDTGGSGVAGVTYQRSGPSGWVTIPAAWDTTSVTDGLYDLRAVVTDRAGNSTVSAVVAGRRVDNTAPSAAISDPGANLRGLVTLSSVTSDSGSGVATVTYQRSDPSGWVTIPAAWDTTTVPADGLYDLRVVVVDVAGNQAIDTVTGRRVDNTAPTAAMGNLDSPIRGTVTLGSTTSDAGSGVATTTYERQAVGTTGWTATPATFDTTTASDGDYDIHVVATDAAGNSTTSAPARTHIDNTSPRPGAVTPTSGASGVATTVAVTATFPRAMLAGSITTTSFTLTSSSGAVPGAVSYDAATTTAKLTPTAALAENTTYTATLTTAVTAQDGATLYQPYTWSFSTGVMPPTVTAKTPSSGATNVAVTVAPTATFSRPMDETTINAGSATLSSASGGVAAGVGYNATSRTVTITPNTALANGTTYTVTLTSSIKSQDGLALTPVSWSFTTVAGAPSVVSTTPSAGATGVPTGTTVSVVFDRDMNSSSLNSSTITLTGAGGAVAAAVTYTSASKTATLTPSAPLASGATYTATVSGSVQSSTGTAMGSASTWTFTTTTGPEVRSTTPADGATGVSMSIVPTVQMSTALDATTVTSTNVKLIRPDTSLVSISVAYNTTSHVITITPASPLDYSGKFTIRLETGITAGGVPMGAPFTSTFTTTGTGVATRINAGSSTAYTATSGNVFVADTGFIGGTTHTVTNTITGTTDPTLYKSERTGTWQYAINVPNGTYDLKLHFVELTSTACNQRVFSVDVLNTTQANDVSNLDIFCEVGANKPDIKTISNVMVSARSLRLKAVAGTVGTPEIAAIEIIPHPPTAAPSTPAAGATGVAVGTTISAVFSQAMDASSLTQSNVTLTGPGGVAVAASVAYDGTSKTVTLTPAASLAHSTTYTARLDGTIRDSYGLLMGTPATWTFTTG